MKRFLTAIGFCAFCLVCGLIFLSPKTRADGNIISELLKLPAPPPPNTNFQSFDKNFSGVYEGDTAPGDDAPIEDLEGFWLRQSQIDSSRQYTLKPSARTVERMMDLIEKDPERLTEYLNVFSHSKDGTDFVKRLYDTETGEKKFGRDWRESVKRWLTYNSPYFSDELLRVAENVKDENSYVTNQDELLALAKVDWEKARPLINRLMNDSTQPVSQTLARWAAYQHALDEKDSSEAERLRAELQKTVEDKNQLAGNRDLAMDALVRGGDFEGRDEWYLKLLEDETLHDLQVNGATYTGLTTIISHSPSGKYTARMLELLRSGNRAVRSAVVRNLAVGGNIKDPEVLRALLPWLSDPNWATDVNNSRRAVIYSLSQVKLPESVPGLISLLNEKRKERTIGRSANVVANSASVVRDISANSNTAYGEMVETYAYRYEAISALAIQRDISAVPALRAVLPEVDGWQKSVVMNAILKSGGYTADEQVDAVETTARSFQKRQEVMREAVNRVGAGTNTAVAKLTVETRRESLRESYTIQPPPPPIPGNNESPEALQIMLGQQIIQDQEPNDELVRTMIDRISSLEKREPAISQMLRAFMRNWRGTAINLMLLKDLQNNKSQTEDILKILSVRKELRENLFNDIYAIRSGNNIALGISACLIENSGDYDSILASENNEAKAAMFACARLVRANLPVKKVAENLASPDKILQTAAEKYLESEDSPEARAIVWARYPNQAKILGARTMFGEVSDGSQYLLPVFQSLDYTANFAYYIYTEFPDLIKTEEKLRKEVIENSELLSVYAYDKNFIRVYKDKAVFSWEEDPARFRERILEENEFSRLKSYIESQRATDFAPFLSLCNENCEGGKELLMMSRNGGRRVFMYGSKVPEFFAELNKIFDDMRRPPAKLKYYLQEKVKGLEILYADENLEAVTLWKNGTDFRVLINSEQRREQIEKEISAQEELEIEKIAEQDYEKYAELERKNIRRRQMREYESYLWYRFDGTKISETISQPAGIGFVPPRDGASIQPDQEIWKKRTANFDIRADETGTYKVANGRMTKIYKNMLLNIVVSPNGKWLVGKNYGSEENQYMPTLLRINLLTGKSFKIPLEGYNIPDAIVSVPGVNKILLGNPTYEQGDYEEEVSKVSGYFNLQLLDPETGAIQKAKEEIKPLTQQTFRPLQPVTGKPDEFWTATPDEQKNLTQIGIFNVRTMTFKSLMTIPQIEFDSMKMWVDEVENKVYFAYSGQILSLPLNRR